MDLRIVGGHPALDLANTVAPRQPGADHVEFLPDPAALLRWAPSIGIVTDAEVDLIEHCWAAEPDLAPAALADVLDLRAMVDLTLAGHSLDRLSRRWAKAMRRSTLAPAAQKEPAPGERVTLLVGTDPAFMIADRLADAVVDLLRNADLARLRACPVEEGGCGFLFLDQSRNLSRRWCSMEDCGAQAKSRRLTERRRARR